MAAIRTGRIRLGISHGSLARKGARERCKTNKSLAIAHGWQGGERVHED
ncbi:MAG: hypothetical protein ACMUIA_03955 [bacterium]